MSTTESKAEAEKEKGGSGAVRNQGGTVSQKTSTAESKTDAVVR